MMHASEGVSSAAGDDDVAPEAMQMRAEDEGGTGRASIEEKDLPDVLESDASAANLRSFQEMWDAEQERAARVLERHMAQKKHKPLPKAAYPSLHRAIVKDFLTSMWYVQIFMCAACTAKLVQALALGYLLQTFEGPADSTGYLWAGVLVLCGFVVLMEHHHVFFWTWRKGMQYRISSIAAVYAKSLRLSSTSIVEQLPSSTTPDKSSSKATSKATASSGKIVNIATNDVERFILATLFCSYIIWVPLESIAILALGWSVIGWSFAAGFGLLLFLFVPLQLWLSKKFAFMRSKIAAITDERVTMVSQAVSGVRVMKMSGWEDQFEERIAAIRKKEVDSIERVFTYRVLNEAIFFFCSVTTSVIIFIIHVAAGGVLTPRNVFTTTVLINVAQMEITKHLSLAVMGTSECWVSISRIQRFLETPELVTGEEQPLASDDNEFAAIVASHVTCHWNGNGKSSVRTLASDADAENIVADASGLIVALEDVNVEFDLGTLTCIIGAVGAGKSALIQMLAGELPISAGTIRRRNSSIAYAPQDAWIMNGTIKENIMLGLNFDPKLYSDVIHACGLNVDLAQLRDGEETIVGDRGVQLSGGQRARIALARAFYRDADILLLDDPLSAVDSRVGRLLFYSAIQDLGFKRGKCVVLVTHQHQFIANSRCLYMAGGRITCIGSYQKCVEESNGKLTLAVQTSSDDLTKLSNTPQDTPSRAPKDAVTKDGKESKSEGEMEAKGGDQDDDYKEQSNTGVVQRQTFLDYARAMPGGLVAGLLMMVLFAITQGSVLVCVAATGRWSEVPPEEQTSASIIGLVSGLAAAVIVLAIGRAFASFHLMLEASKNLHNEMTKSVLRAKIEFFDTNPLGRILNRFSGDVGSNDDLLPTTLFDFLVCSFLVLGALASAVAVLPITLVFIPPLCWYFWRVRSIFLQTSRELKRIEGVARSPIFAMLSESLSGIATIRANNALDYFQKKFWEVHDAHGRAFFAFIACSRWLGFRMDALMFIFLAIASFAAVIVHQQAWFDIDPGILGLALSMLIQLSGLFQWCVRQSAEVVNQFVAVERVIGFAHLPPEAALTNDYDETITEWPGKGVIEVKDLSVRYRSGLPLSLRGLSFRIEGGSRVGIVGRTGGGKSTLVQSLLRLLEAEDGQILIDGVDVSKLGLHKLRTSISVIPQSPVLYGGSSLRDNLDPFHTHDDEKICEALLDVHMLEPVRALSHGLDTTVAEGGSNFSTGQRQLLCLARAILRRNKILVLDEPTANVDSRTDKLLQEAVAKSFDGATILAVAHRLDSIIEYDRILVLGAGGLLEYGTPHELIVKGGAFCQMIDDTGEEMASILKARARSNAT
ncbi:hypothetical protein ACHAXT_013048 [Thalassiosira profunda]